MKMRIERIKNATITIIVSGETQTFINYIDNDNDHNHIRFADFNPKDVALKDYLTKALIDDAIVNIVLERTEDDRDKIVRVWRK